MSWFEDLKAQVSSLEAEHSDFYEKKTGAAGDRMRKVLQAIKGTAQNGRKDIAAMKPVFKADKTAAKNAAKKNKPVAASITG